MSENVLLSEINETSALRAHQRAAVTKTSNICIYTYSNMYQDYLLISASLHEFIFPRWA